MFKNLRTIKIGHGAYSGVNSLKYVTSKAAAVRELMTRGVTRDGARAAIQLVSSRPNGYEVIDTSEGLIEILAMHTEQAWN